MITNNEEQEVYLVSLGSLDFSKTLFKYVFKSEVKLIDSIENFNELLMEVKVKAEERLTRLKNGLDIDSLKSIVITIDDLEYINPESTLSLESKIDNLKFLYELYETVKFIELSTYDIKIKINDLKINAFDSRSI